MVQIPFRISHIIRNCLYIKSSQSNKKPGMKIFRAKLDKGVSRVVYLLRHRVIDNGLCITRICFNTCFSL